jgi:hypothetical protein
MSQIDISHVDVTRFKEYREEAAKLAGEASIARLFHHLSASRLLKRGLQTRDAENNLGQLLGDLADD